MPRLTIILVRHAEAETLARSDHDRVLTPSGRSQAESVGTALAKLLSHCDIAVVSAAVRARQTFEGIARSFHAKALNVDPRLYSANGDSEFSNIIKAHAKDEVRAMLIVGHNPAISVSATIYSGISVQFAPAEFLILNQEAPSWDIALDADGCWEKATL